MLLLYQSCQGYAGAENLDVGSDSVNVALCGRLESISPSSRIS